MDIKQLPKAPESDVESSPTDCPRPEYPRPQFRRDDWINLNGTWSFEIDQRQPWHLAYDSNAERPHGGPHDPARLRPPARASSKGFSRSILVPFAPESELSGIGEKDMVDTIWYHREISIPEVWAGKKIMLNFGAVFYNADVFIDGVPAGIHYGGSASFSLDITRFVRFGKSQDLVVGVTSNLWDGSQPSGKQAWKHDSWGCWYTRTTGIWQTVWMEPVAANALERVQILANLDSSRFVLVPTYYGLARGQRLVVSVFYGGTLVAGAELIAADGIPVFLDLDEVKPWSPENPQLYDLELRVLDAGGVLLDKVYSYAGLRKVHIEGNRFFLNNQPYYQRLVLDQGFYPAGIWTAPSDEALRRDIELAKAAGFNGARLHQKVFEERFYWWADKLGYLCWGETPSWGLDYNDDGLPARNFLGELKEIIVRDRNHPAIVAWTPFNESVQYFKPRNHERLHIEAYRLCKDLDPGRPVNDSSGYIHHRTDLWTVHSYEQAPDELARLLATHPIDGPFRNFPAAEAPYEGQPYLVDEFGGIKWDPATQDVAAQVGGLNKASWGYGKPPQSIEEFYTRLEGQVRALMELGHIDGWCYTQLTNVEQEQNGIYNYDRTVKFDMERIRKIFTMERKGE